MENLVWGAFGLIIGRLSCLVYPDTFSQPPAFGKKIKNLNSDTAGSVVFKFLLFQLPDCNTVTVVGQHSVGIWESETRNANCHFGDWLLALWTILKVGND